MIPDVMHYLKLSMKLAFNADDARAVLKIVKPKQLRAADRFGVSGGFAALHGAATTLRNSKVIAKAAKPSSRMADMKMWRESIAQGRATGILRDAPHIITPERGDMTRRMIRSGEFPQHVVRKAKKLKGDQRMMLDGVIKGHENAEIPATVNPGFLKKYQHNSPKIILQEHNMVKTLPGEHEPVGDVMRAMRLRREARALKAVLPQFTYGKSERLSRHAIKRVGELYDKAQLAKAQIVKPAKIVKKKKIRKLFG